MSKPILAFKLISGEELIAKVTEETTTSFILEDPLALHVTAGQNGVNVGLIPFMMSNRDATEFTLSRSAVTAYTPPSRELETGYLQQISKIDLTTKLR